MAYIYQIQNDVNGKLYVGKTEFSIEKRFKEHCRDAFKDRNEKRPLYSAMKKYGIEHFHISLIEETDNPEEREKYWIEYLGTFKNGYNATMGGDGKRYIDYDLVYSTYLNTKSVIKTAELCNIDESYAGLILNSFSITSEERKNNSIENHRKPVAMLDKKTGQILEVFSSETEATKKYPQVNNHIHAVCKGKRKSCGGYGWKYLE